MTEQVAITLEDALKKIRELRKSLSETDIYYKLKARGIHYIKEETVECVAWCLAITRAGFPITARLVATLSKRNLEFVRSSLHILGDKHILTLLRDPAGEIPATTLVWRVNEKLLDIAK